MWDWCQRDWKKFQEGWRGNRGNRLRWAMPVAAVEWNARSEWVGKIFDWRWSWEGSFVGEVRLAWCAPGARMERIGRPW